MTDQKDHPTTLVLYTQDEDGSSVALVAKRHRQYGERFLTMFETSMTTLAAMDRPGVYFRVLMQCLAVMDPLQYRRISAREIAEGAEISHISAQRGLTMLVKDGVLLTKGKGTGLAYRINNRVAWGATAERRAQTTRDPEVIDARGRS